MNRAAPYYADGQVVLFHGDALHVAQKLATASVRTIVTSPPYFGLRDYGHPDQIGAEILVEDYIARLVDLFRELRRVLTDDGTLWINLGDSFAPDGGKQLLGIPWRVAFALQADGWLLRSDIVWAKPNPMPEPVTDRPTRSHEFLFLLAKRRRYHYDADAIREPDSGRASGNGFVRDHRISIGGRGREQEWTPGAGRNRRDVWTVSAAPFPEAHFAVYPPELVRPCILAGSEPGDTVLDPFSGSGTTGQVALYEGRRYIGIDLSADYLDLSLRTRFAQPPLIEVQA